MKNQTQEKEEVPHRMVDAKRTPSQSCRLCSALKKEIARTRTQGETEREGLLNFLLKGHQEACHAANNAVLPSCHKDPDMANTRKDLYKWETRMV